MATIATRLTVEDFERLPSEVIKTHDLVHGELVEVPGNTMRHTVLRDRLGFDMTLFLTSKELGLVAWEQPFDFLGNVRTPDLAFISTARRPQVDMTKLVQRFAPDLAIEIISPSNQFDEVMRKKELYLKAGTDEAWVLSSAVREMLVYGRKGKRIIGAGEILTSDLLPGFSLDIGTLFQGLD